MTHEVSCLSFNNDVAEPGSAHTSDSWYVLYTKHQHEKSVADSLSQKQFEVFLPLYTAVRRWKDRNKRLSLPLFPCYVFVRGGHERRLHVLETPGVHAILTIEGRIAPVPDSEIEAVRRVVESPLNVGPHPYLKCGDRVRVKWGALEGVEGILIRRKNQCRLVISVEMLAQSAVVDVDAMAVEPVSPRDVKTGSLRQKRQSMAVSLGVPTFDLGNRPRPAL